MCASACGCRPGSVGRGSSTPRTHCSRRVRTLVPVRPADANGAIPRKHGAAASEPAPRKARRREPVRRLPARAGRPALSQRGGPTSGRLAAERGGDRRGPRRAVAAVLPHLGPRQPRRHLLDPHQPDNRRAAHGGAAGRRARARTGHGLVVAAAGGELPGEPPAGRRRAGQRRLQPVARPRPAQPQREPLACLAALPLDPRLSAQRGAPGQPAART